MRHKCKVWICMACQIYTYVQFEKAIKEWDRKKRGGKLLQSFKYYKSKWERGGNNKIKWNLTNTQKKKKIKNFITGTVHSPLLLSTPLLWSMLLCLYVLFSHQGDLPMALRRERESAHVSMYALWSVCMGCDSRDREREKDSWKMVRDRMCMDLPLSKPCVCLSILCAVWSPRVCVVW